MKMALFFCLESLPEKLRNNLEVKIYVGNMSYETTEDNLRTLFAQAGTVVTVDVIKDRDTHRPKGFAFVTMSSQAEATNAIDMFNGKEVNGRPLTVNVARPREERPSGGRSYNNNRSNRRGGGGSNSRY
jgi:RNA recognition motif-containing protein